MKANLKGRGGIKGLLLLHGEKVAIAVVGLLALWFVYSSLQLPSLESQYQASNLQDQIRQTNDEIEKFDWETAIRDHADKMRVVKPIAKSGDKGVDFKSYVIDGLDSAVIAPTVLRADPMLRNVIDVRAIGGSGLLAYHDEQTRRRQEIKQRMEQEELEKEREKQLQEQQANPEGAPGRGRGGPEEGLAQFDPRFPKRRPVEGVSQAAVGVVTQGFERIERAHWAMVVAKVPIREQLKLYQDAFENARGGFDPARDFPQYAGFVVERAEVVGGKLSPWQKVNLYDGQRKYIDANRPIERGVNTRAVNALYAKAQAEWAGMAVDPVDPNHKNYLLTLPLPPLVGRDWGADATHPDIPLAIDVPIDQGIEPALEQPEDKPADSDEQFSFDSGEAGQGFGPTAGAMQPRPMTGPGFGGRGEFGPGAMPYGRGGSEMGGGEFRGGAGLGGGVPVGGQATSLPRGVDFYLLRFFDFTVEPGKKYKYRVKLAMVDPNHGLPDNVLEQAVQDRQRKEWQAVRARDKDKAKRPTTRLVEDYSEPSPTVGIPLSGSVWLAEAAPKNEKLHNDEPTATVWAETFDIDNDGQAINVAQEEEIRRGSVVNLEDEMQFAGPGSVWVDEFEEPYKLQTGYTLLDVDGAERFNKDIAAPARILLMGPAGELMIRTETDDRTAVSRLRIIFAEPNKRRGGREDMRGGPEGMRFPRPGLGGPGGRGP
jgi:hypothetical protein